MTDQSPVKTQQPKETFRQQLSDMFEDMWDHIGRHHMGISGRVPDGVTPSTDLSDNKDALTMTMELPGMEESDVEITVTKGRMTVKGEKSQEHEDAGDGYIFRERAYGSFMRTFAMPPDVDDDRISAEFDKGVLTVRVPRTGELAPADSKRIRITSK